MVITGNRRTSKGIVLSILLVLFFRFSAQAQVRDSDSLEVLQIVNEAHDHLLKRNYEDATRIAWQGFDKSTKLDFKWGIINNLMIMGQAQKLLLNYPSSLNYFLQALSEIQKRNDLPMLKRVNQRIGELFQEWGVPEKALPYYTAAFTLQSSAPTDQSIKLIERLAEVHLSLNQREQSLNRYFQVLTFLQEQSDREQIITILKKIAFIYYQSGDLGNSLKYNLQMLELNKQLNDVPNTAATLNIIGNHYKELRNFDKALEYYQEALALNKRTNVKGVNDNSLVTNLINIGVIYQARGDTRNSIKSFKDALEIKERKGTLVELAVMHNYLASIYLTIENFAEAEKHTNEAIDLLSRADNKRILATNYKRLSEIYGKQGNYARALVSYQTYSMLKDSLLYQEQLEQEKEKIKELVIERTEKDAKLNLIDQEMQSLELRNEKALAEREKQEFALLLKEKELQNVSLQNKQLEQSKAVQQLQLQQGKIEKEKQEQEILLLEQRHDLREAEIQRTDLERRQEIALKNSELALQQAQLDRVQTQQQYLSYTVGLFAVIILLVMIGYWIKRRDNNKLQAQKEQIESINKSLVELNEEKNDLIGIVAHDLKSPLNQISGMLEIIKLTSKDQPTDMQEYTQKIEQSTNRLRKMVTKILDVSAIEAKTLNLNLEKIDLVVLLNEMIGRFENLAEKKGITIRKEFENHIPFIVSDVGYVSESLENLMSNAVKYSPLDKQVNVKVSRRGSFVRIEFVDQGQGINEKDMKKLFGKYHKLTARPTAGEDSTGLGLSIVKKYITALNGRVWCESEEGKGSNFIVELPV